MLNYDLDVARGMIITDNKGVEIADIFRRHADMVYAIRWIEGRQIHASLTNPVFKKLEAAKYYVLASYIEHTEQN